ncbi:tenascin-n isoform x1 [Limosa lapponica baueri]|uniref:Tenascin-n isoform x1 n=1 Tax=Limosa lapponica baueri TaxID=1758121 RepID=A0A2I0U7W7_LIMLA|nr:tenascin-n isoform x1 [Limosa lapponica baueri]
MDFQSWLAFPMGVLLCSAFWTSAIQQPASHNCTSNGQRISFSHSYKIDLPTSSQIKVEADPLQHEDNSGVQLDPGEAEENEEQNIIFRHNIHVHAPKGDCEALAHFKDLLERMEKLEKEVAELREVCSPQKCCGGSQGVSHCSGHGTFLYETCSCKCDEGWEGNDCSRPTCPGQCSGHGRCDGQKCICDEPYFGEDCSQKLCPENCSGNGICDTAKGVCQCYKEFIGEDCSEKRCPGDCSGNGFCDTGECYCHEGFFGLNCSQVLAPQNLQLLNSTENSLAVSWDQIIDVDNYLLSYYPVGSETLVKQVHVPEKQLSYEIVGLRPGTAYNVTLRHVKKGFASEPKYLEASTEIDSPTELLTDQVTEDTITVSWNKVQASIDRYRVSYTSANGDTEEREVDKDKNVTTLAGLKPGMEYTIYIWAEKGEQQSKRASTEAVTEVDSPRNLVTDQVTEDTATISWDSVQAPIDRYMVSYTSADGDTKEVEVQKDRSITTLTGLKPGMKYTIHLWAELGSKESKRVSIDLLTEIDPPKNLRVSDVTHSTGVVTWTPPAADIDGYTLTYQGQDGMSKVFQRRSTGELDFYKRWKNYVEGFGDPTGEFWLGLDKLHNLTSSSPIRYELRVDLWTASESVYAVYDFFQVASGKDRYRLSVGNYRGNAGDAMTYHNGWKFTTWDRDNDVALSNCALTHHGAWWYKNCHLANLNGKYGESKHSERYLGPDWGCEN